ncbi:MAG: helix-turn-helix transcriptional regulator [bacterium]|jgi:DNA-binding CsgD family transcriptional regulator
MFHITHFVLIFSFAVGLAAITVSAQMYMRYRLGYLRAHLAIVVCFNLMLFLSIITLYLFGLPPGAVPEFVLRSMGWTHQFLTPLLQILAAYFFMQIISGLLEMPVRRLFRNVAWAVIGGYATLQFTALVTSISAGNMPLSLLIARIVWLGSLGAIYAMLIASLPRVGGVEDLGRRRALKAYWYLIMGLMTVILALIVLNGIGYLQIARYNLVTGLVIVVMNAVPVLYLRWFLERFHVRREAGAGITEDPTSLFERYGISPREREVIAKVCMGKTNREIADELFISLQTVKDHVYRIYRKTGVKNRAQLVALFIRPES